MLTDAATDLLNQAMTHSAARGAAPTCVDLIAAGLRDLEDVRTLWDHCGGAQLEDIERWAQHHDDGPLSVGGSPSLADVAARAEQTAGDRQVAASDLVVAAIELPGIHRTVCPTQQRRFKGLVDAGRGRGTRLTLLEQARRAGSIASTARGFGVYSGPRSVRLYGRSLWSMLVAQARFVAFWALMFVMGPGILMRMGVEWLFGRIVSAPVEFDKFIPYGLPERVFEEPATDGRQSAVALVGSVLTFAMGLVLAIQPILRFRVLADGNLLGIDGSVESVTQAFSSDTQLVAQAMLSSTPAIYFAISAFYASAIRRQDAILLENAARPGWATLLTKIVLSPTRPLARFDSALTFIGAPTAVGSGLITVVIGTFATAAIIQGLAL